jgi:hypothetical protein
VKGWKTELLKRPCFSGDKGALWVDNLISLSFRMDLELE